MATLFNIQFCVVAIDEIHEFRGPRSRGFIGAVAIARSASLVIGCSATPIVSQPRVSCPVGLLARQPLYFLQDLINIGRILRLEWCCGEQGRKLELDFNRRLRSAQRDITKEDKQESALATANAFKANGAVEDVGLSLRHTAVKAVRYEMVRFMQKRMGHIMIRRTLQSTRWDGTKINPNLPDKSVFNFLVHLTEEEHVVLNGELGIVGESIDGQVFDFEVSRLCLLCPMRTILTWMSELLGALPPVPLRSHPRPVFQAEQRGQMANLQDARGFSSSWVEAHEDVAASQVPSGKPFRAAGHGVE
jgi:hypothetical protein